MALDWGEIEKDNQRYKNYAKPGVYEVKCEDVVIKEVGTNGSVVQEFVFAEDDSNKYPKATHWLTFKEGKEAWRQYHNRQLMIVLGSDKETAEKAIDKIEALKDKEKIMKGYETVYKNLLKKNHKVEIEVYQDGKYTKSEFTDRTVAMPHESKPAPVDDDVAPMDIEDDDELDLSSLPF